MLCRFILALALASLALSGDATIYKWIDERGVTQYAQTPPAGQAAERLRIPQPMVESTDDTQPRMRWPESRWEGAYGVPPERVRLAGRGARARAAAAERVHTCVRAHWNLRSLDEQRPFLRVHLEPDAREAERHRLRRVVWENCDMP